MNCVRICKFIRSKQSKNLLILVLPVAVFISEPFSVLAQEIKIEYQTFNSEFSDFSPAYYKDGVVFSTNRMGSLYEDDVDSLRRFYTDLFFIQIDKSHNPIGEPHLMSKELTTFLNEGPCVFSEDNKMIYYTGNVIPLKAEKRQRVDQYKLGIFTAKIEGDKFFDINPLFFNTTNGKYDCAHPALSPDNQTLVFASNRDRKNNMDLFFCTRMGDTWSEPEPLNNGINSSKTEIFPYFNQEGVLFFASNRGVGRSDMDIYRTEYKNGVWTKPVALPRPINTKSDDFTYVETTSGINGYVSSNRQTAEDDIFSFEYSFPPLKDCKKNGRQSFCYLIEEESFVNLDSLPMQFEWDLGDGTNKTGISIKHCYADTGRYIVSLNIRDTTTNQIYVNVSQNELIIERSNKPYILSSDTISMHAPLVFEIENSELRNEIYFWETNYANRYVGSRHKHQFSKSGTQILSLIASPIVSDSIVKSDSQCVFKQIVVYENEEELALLRSKKSDMASLQDSDKSSGIAGTRILALDDSMKIISGDGALQGFTLLRRSEIVNDGQSTSFSAVPWAETVNKYRRGEVINQNAEFRRVSRLNATKEEILDYLKKTMSGQQTPNQLEVVKFETEKIHFQARHDANTILEKSLATEQPNKVPENGNNPEVNLNEILVDKSVRFEKGAINLTPDNIDLLKYISVIMDIEAEVELKVIGQVIEGAQQDETEKLYLKRFEVIESFLVRQHVARKRIVSGIYTIRPTNGALVGVMSDAELENVIEFRLVFSEDFSPPIK